MLLLKLKNKKSSLLEELSWYVLKVIICACDTQKNTSSNYNEFRKCSFADGECTVIRLWQWYKPLRFGFFFKMWVLKKWFVFSWRVDLNCIWLTLGIERMHSYIVFHPHITDSILIFRDFGERRGVSWGVQAFREGYAK